MLESMRHVITYLCMHTHMCIVYLTTAPNCFQGATRNISNLCIVWSTHIRHGTSDHRGLWCTPYIQGISKKRRERFVDGGCDHTN